MHGWLSSPLAVFTLPDSFSGQSGLQVSDKQRDFVGATALHAAAQGGHAKLVAKLLAEGSEVDAMMDVGRTTVLSGCARDIPFPQDGRTALHIACMYGRAEVVKQLLRAGASPLLPALGSRWVCSPYCYYLHRFISQGRRPERPVQPPLCCSKWRRRTSQLVLG